MRRRSDGQKSDKPTSRDIVLKAAISEFVEHGLSGGRVDRIAKRAKLNKQAIYYYFKNKDALFAAALTFCYTQFRIGKPDWTRTVSPIDALRACVNETFNLVQASRNHAALIIDENRNKGRHIDRDFRSIVNPTTYGSFQVIKEIVERGQLDKIFRKDVNAEDVYLDVVSLSFFVVDHRYTIGEVIGKNLADKTWLKKRRAHVEQMVVASLLPRG